MNDLLDQPAGDFDWGPESRRWIPRRKGDSRDAFAAFWPLITVAIGAALLAIGAGLAWASPQTASLGDQQPPPAEERTMTAVAAAVIVHVTGMVEHPGIVSVAVDGRASDAVAAAGGPLPGADLAQINLAARVTDGMQLHVPTTAPPDTALSPAADTSATATALSLTQAPTQHPPPADTTQVASQQPPAPTADTTQVAGSQTTTEQVEPRTAATQSVTETHTDAAQGPDIDPAESAHSGPLNEDGEPVLSPEFEAFLRGQTGEPSREEHAPFFDANEVDD